MSKFMRISADADPDAELRYISSLNNVLFYGKLNEFKIEQKAKKNSNKSIFLRFLFLRKAFNFDIRYIFYSKFKEKSYMIPYYSVAQQLE